MFVALECRDSENEIKEWLFIIQNGSMVFRALVWICLLFFSSCGVGKREKEQAVVEKLVMLRTEGLALAEFIASNAKDSAILLMCQRIKDYYIQTHPDFLHVCAGRPMGLTERDFDELWSRIEYRLRTDCTSFGMTSLKLCEENIDTSIALHEEILEAQEWEDICYFSFVALPDLYNQRSELHSLRKRLEQK